MLEEPRAQLASCMVVPERRAIGLAEVAVSKFYINITVHAYEECQGRGRDYIAIISGNSERERHLGINTDHERRVKREHSTGGRKG